MNNCVKDKESNLAPPPPGQNKEILLATFQSNQDSALFLTMISLNKDLSSAKSK